MVLCVSLYISLSNTHEPMPSAFSGHLIHAKPSVGAKKSPPRELGCVSCIISIIIIIISLHFFSKQGFMASSSYVMEIAQSWEEKKKKLFSFFKVLALGGAFD